jgi:glutamate carboxypeptidase
MLAALAAFEAHPAADAIGYTVLLSPDEETGSLASAPLLAELGASAHVGMTYEPALADGTLVSARKGSGNFHLRIAGRAAHAGRDFASGRNAILAAARIAQALGALNGQRDGVTVNVARIDGGAPLNMVPDIAVLRFNARLPDAASATGVQLGRANELIRSESDEVLAVGTSLSLGLAVGLLLGGASRLLVILALIPATAMGFTLFDRHSGATNRFPR